MLTTNSTSRSFLSTPLKVSSPENFQLKRTEGKNELFVAGPSFVSQLRSYGKLNNAVSIKCSREISKPVSLMNEERKLEGSQLINIESRRTFLVTGMAIITLAANAISSNASAKEIFRQNLQFNLAFEGTLKGESADNVGTLRSQPAASPLVDDNAVPWQRCRGDGFAVMLPPDFKDITPVIEEDESTRTTLGSGPQTPFTARYISPDLEEIVTVVTKPTTSVKLTFLEVKDISDYGSILEAAPLFVPAGGKLLAIRELTQNGRVRDRTHYLYEFVSQGRHAVISAAVAKGKVYVLGANTSIDNWRNAAGRLRSVAKQFSLVY